MPVLAAAVVDCEALHTGWPDQPVNAWSSLAFVFIGLVLFNRRTVPAARFIGVATGLVGLGSLAFHGGHSDLSGWAHDWSIAALLVLLLLFGGHDSVPSLRVGSVLVGAALLLGFLPGAGEWLHGALAVALVVRELTLLARRRPRPMIIAAALLAAGAALTVLGRTGGAWCDPGSILQPHAAWHALAAASLASYAVARRWLPSRMRSGS